MTNRQQSAFFLVIVFLFTCGAGLLIYKQYDAYYKQKTEMDLETVSSFSPVSKGSSAPSASTTQEQISGWKTYKNDQYGFEFQYSGDYTESEARFNAVGYIDFFSKIESNPKFELDFPKGASIINIAREDIKSSNCSLSDGQGNPVDRIVENYRTGLIYTADHCGAGDANYKFIIENPKNTGFIRLTYPEFGQGKTDSLINFKSILATFRFFP